LISLFRWPSKYDIYVNTFVACSKIDALLP
jgi:hypothetical protein